MAVLCVSVFNNWRGSCFHYSVGIRLHSGAEQHEIIYHGILSIVNIIGEFRDSDCESSNSKP